MSRDAIQRPTAVLVGIQLHGVSDEEHAASLAELERLTDTLGYEVIGTVVQKRGALAAAGVLGEGKLKELADLTGGRGVVPSRAPERKTKAGAHSATDTDDEDAADEYDDEDDARPDTLSDGRRRAKAVIVDHDLSPSQARNLERATGATVMDRTGVIVAIFHRHARSREARLQVEIARLVYVAPRMRETGGAERQRGGIGGKGAGESSLELDRRRARDRIAELRAELASIEKEQGTRRARRTGSRRVVLVGYTNAGKSSLMRALTGSEVYVADRLFATLDTTVRALQPEARPRVLVSDTVGFIKKLPHDLVASFRSTLDEALEASLLLHVVDASDPTFRQQYEVTREVLADIGADEVPRRLLLNKCDRLEPAERDALLAEFPEAWATSAHDPDEVRTLRDRIVEWFEHDLETTEIVVPYSHQHVVGEVHASVHVLDERWDEAGGHFTVRGDDGSLARLRSLLARN